MKVNKPWGSFEQLTDNETTTIKIITILAGHRTSLQFHEHRSEKWYVLNGEGYAILDDKKKSRPEMRYLFKEKKFTDWRQ